MNIFKSFLLGILTLAAILAIIYICLPSRVHIQRHVVINAPASATYEQLHELRNWTRWVPWHLEDPHMQLKFSGPQRGEGARYSWASQRSDIKPGIVTIVTAEPNKRLVTNIEYPGNDFASGTFTLEKVEEGTRLTLYLDKYTGEGPIDKFSGLLLNSTVGEEFEKGLVNLKKEVESKQVLTEK